MAGRDPTRVAACGSPLTDINEELVEGDEDIVMFFIAHGKLLFRYPVHNPFVADVGQRTSSTTTTTTAAASTSASAAAATTTGTNNNNNSAGSYAVSSASAQTTTTSTPAGTGTLQRATSKRSSSGNATRPAGQPEAGDNAHVDGSTAKGRTSASTTAAPASPASTTEKPPLGKGDVSSPTASATAHADAPAKTNTTASSAEEPQTTSRRQRRRQKALQKAAAAAAKAGEQGASTESLKDGASKAIAPPPRRDTSSPVSAPSTASPSPASRTESGPGQKLSALGKAQARTASTADLSSSAADADQVGALGGLASPASATVGVLSKRKRAGHVQEPNTAGSPSTNSPSSVTATATAASMASATTSAAVAGVAPQRGFRRPASSMNLAAASSSVRSGNGGQQTADISAATTTASSSHGPSQDSKTGNTTTTPPHAAGEHRCSSQNGGTTVAHGKQPPDAGSSTQPQPPQQDTCIGIQTNAFLHLLRASLAGCTTIHVASITFLVYPLTAQPQTDATSSEDKAAQAECRLGQTRLMPNSTRAMSTTAATLVVAMRRPDTDSGSLARFVQCFINSLCREEVRVGYVREQVRLMENIAAVWESGGIEAVMAAAPLGAGTNPNDNKACEPSSSGVADPSSAADGRGRQEDDAEGAYYAYLTDANTPLGAVARGAGLAEGQPSSRRDGAANSTTAAAWDGSQSLVALRAKHFPNVFSFLSADESPVRLCRELTQLTKCVNYWSGLWKAELASGAWGAAYDSDRALGTLHPQHGRGPRAPHLISRTAQARWLARCCTVLKRPVLSASMASTGVAYGGGAASPLAGRPAGYVAGGSSLHGTAGRGSAHGYAAPASAVATHQQPSFVAGVEVNRLLFLSASFLVAGHAGISTWTRPDDLFASPYARMSPCGLITVYNDAALSTAMMQRAYVETVGTRVAELLPLSVVSQCLRDLMIPRQVGALYRSLEEALLCAGEAHAQGAGLQGHEANHVAGGTVGRLPPAAIGYYSPSPSLETAASADSSSQLPHQAQAHTTANASLQLTAQRPARQLPARHTAGTGTSSATSSLRSRPALGTGSGSAVSGAPATDLAGFDVLAMEVMEWLKAQAVIGVEGELFICFTHGDLAGVDQIEDGIRRREKQLKKRLRDRADRRSATPMTTGLSGGLSDGDSVNVSTTETPDSRHTAATAPTGMGATSTSATRTAAASPRSSRGRSVRWIPSSLTMMLLEQAQRLQQPDHVEQLDSAEDAMRLAAAAAGMCAEHWAGRDAPSVSSPGIGNVTPHTPSSPPPPLHVVHCVWGPACPLCEDLASTPAAWTLRPTAELAAQRAAHIGHAKGSTAVLSASHSSIATTASPQLNASVSAPLSPAFLELRFPFLDRAVRATCQRRASRWWLSVHRAHGSSGGGAMTSGTATVTSGAATPGYSPISTPQYGFHSHTVSGHASPTTPYGPSSGADLTPLTAPAFQSAARPWFLKPEMYMAPSPQHAISAVRLYKDRLASPGLVSANKTGVPPALGVGSPTIRPSAVPSAEEHSPLTPARTAASSTRSRAATSQQPASFTVPASTSPRAASSPANPSSLVDGHSSKGALPAADEDETNLLLTAEAIAVGAVEWLREFAPVAQARLDATRQRRLRLSRSACTRHALSTGSTTTGCGEEVGKGGRVHGHGTRTATVGGRLPVESADTAAAHHQQPPLHPATKASLPISVSRPGGSVDGDGANALGASHTPRCSPLSSPFMRYSKRVLPQRTPPTGVFTSQQDACLFTDTRASHESRALLPAPAAGPAAAAATTSPPSPALGLPEVVSQTPLTEGTRAPQKPHPVTTSAVLALTYTGRVLPVEVLLQVAFHHLVVITWGAADGVELDALVRGVERSLRRLPPLLTSLRYVQQLQLEYGTSERMAAELDGKARTDAALSTRAATASTASGPGRVISACSETSRHSTVIHYPASHGSVQLLRAYEVFEAMQLLPILLPYAGCQVQIVSTRLLLHAVMNEFSDVIVPRAASATVGTHYVTASR